MLNERPYIEQSVAAMRRQRCSGRLEFIFADGGSSDGTRELLEQLAQDDPRIRVVDNPRQTVSSGLNVALRNAVGEWVARMDAHSIYPENYLAIGISRLQQGGTRWVSGPQVPRGRGPVSRAVALALSSSLGRGGSRKWGQQNKRSGREFNLDSGVFAGVWNRSTLLAYGGWDERWPRNSDSEMAARFLAADESLVCLPALSADYVPRDSLGGLWRQYLDYGEYRTRTAYYHPQSLRRSHLLPPALLIDAMLAGIGPRRCHRVARRGLAVYAGAIAYAGLRAVRACESPLDAALVPVVLAIMHFAHGAGMMMGIGRHGLPLPAIASVAKLDRVCAVRARPAEPVFAPSLDSATAQTDEAS